MPFEFDITELVEAGTTFRLSVAVDNRLDYTCIPPGKIIELPDGRREQEYIHDFYNYAGLHRSVHLLSRPKRHVTDVTITTDIDGATGVVNWGIEQSAEGDVRIAIVDQRDGKEVFSGSGSNGQARIADANFWEPGVGGLYNLVITLHDGADDIDEFIEHFGIHPGRTGSYPRLPAERGHARQDYRRTPRSPNRNCRG